MSLFWATLLVGLILFLLGGLFIWNPSWFGQRLKDFPRSTWATWVFFGAGAVWFLWIVAHLGEADFGAYRQWLFLLFAAVGLGAFFYVPDFLAVRGIAILGLLSSRHLLDVAYMQPQASRLVLVTFVYLWIAFSLYMGAAPYRMRDLLGWLYAKIHRVRLLGIVFSLYGAALGWVALNY
jgi:hypothetical protein